MKVTRGDHYSLDSVIIPNKTETRPGKTGKEDGVGITPPCETIPFALDVTLCPYLSKTKTIPDKTETRRDETETDYLTTKLTQLITEYRRKFGGTLDDLANALEQVVLDLDNDEPERAPR